MSEQLVNTDAPPPVAAPAASTSDRDDVAKPDDAANNTDSITTSPPPTSSSAEAAAAPAVKYTKYKMAIVFGYVGYGYFGLQHNWDPAHPTIEAALVEALHDAGYISEENMVGLVMKKISWERASRTDKGVSALRNVVSCKIQLPDGQTEQEWIRGVNKFLLPKNIEVFRMIIATGKFDCYYTCTGRQYEYLLPTYTLLAPNDPNASELREYFLSSTTTANNEAATSSSSSAGLVSSVACDGGDGGEPSLSYVPSSDRRRQREDEDSHSDDENDMMDDDDDEAGAASASSRRRPRDDPSIELSELPKEIYEKMIKFRVPQETVHKLRGFFSVMEGTNSFHNFTPSTPAGNPSANRFIRFIHLSEPYVLPLSNNNNNSSIDQQKEEKDGCVSGGGVVEWIRIRLDGQSFMLNQIRKMVGCAVEAIIRDNFDAGTVRGMFQPGLRRLMPMAPANGLFLATLRFDTYNHRLERIQENGEIGGKKERIEIADVADDDSMRVQVERSVAKYEVDEEICARWIAGLLKTKSEDFLLPEWNPDEALRRRKSKRQYAKQQKELYSNSSGKEQQQQE